MTLHQGPVIKAVYLMVQQQEEVSGRGEQIGAGGKKTRLYITEKFETKHFIHKGLWVIKVSHWICCL